MAEQASALKIQGVSDTLDGVYDIVTPSTRELMWYRQDAGITPSELSEIMVSQGIEMIPVLLFASMIRAGKPRLGVADQLIDLPADVLTELLAQLPDAAAEDDDESIPPKIGLDAGETPSGEPDFPGVSS